VVKHHPPNDFRASLPYTPATSEANNGEKINPINNAIIYGSEYKKKEFKTSQGNTKTGWNK
jgi:hypothetical protein